ncbi:MAG TPA: SAM-dependent methyltransferase [Steroidobacteraceae bacterium]
MTASGAHSILPALSAAEAAHSHAARALIIRELQAAGGWLSFERFMELALYAPGLGYYSAGSVKIGAAGDFVTAPEVSALFGRCVAAQCAELLRETGGDILEVGAGTGVLAATILACLDATDALPERYAILEVSADLADRQRQRLQNLPAALRQRVVWLERLPGSLRGVILANEVLDALPFQRFVIRAGAARELGVALDEGRLTWCEGTSEPGAAADLRLAGLLRSLQWQLPERYAFEVCWRLTPWIAGMAGCLERGALLLCDYGLPRPHYYHPQRLQGTLRCHFKHRAHEDPFINVGVQDITAWVDFTRVAEAAVAVGLEVSGFATQAAFLLGTGIERMVAEVRQALPRAQVAGEARRLLMPGEMGEAFKVMALTRGVQAALRGFAYQDLRASL